MSPKLKCHQNWNLSKLKCHQLICHRNLNVTKTEMSPELKYHQKLKCYLNWNVTKSKKTLKFKSKPKWNSRRSALITLVLFYLGFIQIHETGFCKETKTKTNRSVSLWARKIDIPNNNFWWRWNRPKLGHIRIGLFFSPIKSQMGM